MRFRPPTPGPYRPARRAASVEAVPRTQQCGGLHWQRAEPPGAARHQNSVGGPESEVWKPVLAAYTSEQSCPAPVLLRAARSPSPMPLALSAPGTPLSLVPGVARQAPAPLLARRASPPLNRCLSPPVRPPEGVLSSSMRAQVGTASPAFPGSPPGSCSPSRAGRREVDLLSRTRRTEAGASLMGSHRGVSPTPTPSRWRGSSVVVAPAAWATTPVLPQTQPAVAASPPGSWAPLCLGGSRSPPQPLQRPTGRGGGGRRSGATAAPAVWGRSRPQSPPTPQPRLAAAALTRPEVPGYPGEVPGSRGASSSTCACGGEGAALPGQPPRRLLLTSSGLTRIAFKEAFLGLLAARKPSGTAKVVYIPDAAVGNGCDVATAHAVAAQQLLALGYDPCCVELRGTSPEALAQQLDGVDCLYVDMGNTYYLRYYMHASGFDRLVPPLVRDSGVVYVGASAGSIAAGRTISVAHWKGWDDPGYGQAWDLQKLGYSGLDLLPGGISLFPHYGEQWRGLVEARRQELDHQVVLLDEDHAYILDGAREELISSVASGPRMGAGHRVDAVAATPPPPPRAVSLAAD